MNDIIIDGERYLVTDKQMRECWDLCKEYGYWDFDDQVSILGTIFRVGCYTKDRILDICKEYSQ